MNITALHLVAKANYSGHVIQNDGGKGRYVFMRQPDGKFVRKYENLDRTEVDKRGKIVFPELDRFNRELGDLIEGRRAWPTEVRFIIGEEKAKDSSSENKPPPRRPVAPTVPGIPETLTPELLAEYVRIIGEKSGVPVVEGEAKVEITSMEQNYGMVEGIGFQVWIGGRVARQAVVINEYADRQSTGELKTKLLAVLAAYFHNPDSRLVIDDNLLTGSELPLLRNEDGSVSLAPMDGASDPAKGSSEYGAELTAAGNGNHPAGSLESINLAIHGAVLRTPVDETLPPMEGNVAVPWTPLHEVNASMNCHVLKKIAKTEGSWRDDLKGNAAVVQAILDGRTAKLAQLATA